MSLLEKNPIAPTRRRLSSVLLAAAMAVATIAVAGLTESSVNAAPVSLGNIITDRTLDSNGSFNVYPGEEIIMSGSVQVNFGSTPTCLGVELQAGDVITMTESNLGFSGDFSFNYNVGSENGQATGSSYTLPAGITYLTVSPPQVRRNVTSTGTLTFRPMIRATRSGSVVVETTNCVSPFVSAIIDSGTTYNLLSYVARVGDSRLSYYGEACVDMTLVAPGDVLTYSYELTTNGQNVDPQGGTPNYRWDQSMDGASPGNTIRDPEPTRLQLNIDGASGPNPIAGNTYTFSLDIKKGNDSVAITCPVNNTPPPPPPPPGGGGGMLPMARLYPTGQVSMTGSLSLGSTLTMSLPSWSLSDGGPALPSADVSAQFNWLLCSVGPAAQRTDVASPTPQCFMSNPQPLLADGTFGAPTQSNSTYSQSSLSITQPLLNALANKYLVVAVVVETEPEPGQMMGVFFSFNFKSCAPGENCADSFGPTSAPVTPAPDTTVPQPASPTATNAPATTTTTTLPPPALAVVQALPKASTPIVTDTAITTGEAITVSFGGFTPFEYVQLIVASTPKVIGAGFANAQGVVTISGNLPANLSSGNHTLAVYAPASGIGFSQPITVSQATLPATGLDDQSLLTVLSLFLLVGGVALRRTRRLTTD